MSAIGDQMSQHRTPQDIMAPEQKISKKRIERLRRLSTLVSSRTLAVRKVQKLQEEKKQPYDLLKFGNNPKHDYSLKGEIVVFSARLDKVSRTGDQIARILVITNDSVYVLRTDKKMKQHHKSVLMFIFKVTFSTEEPKDECVIHIAGSDDQHWKGKPSTIRHLVKALRSVRPRLQIVEELNSSLRHIVLRDKTSAISAIELKTVDMYLEQEMTPHDQWKLYMNRKAPYVQNGEKVYYSASVTAKDKKNRETHRVIMVTNKYWYYLDDKAKKVIEQFPMMAVTHITYNGSMTAYTIHQLYKDDQFCLSHDGTQFAEACRLVRPKIKVSQVTRQDIHDLPIWDKKKKKWGAVRSDPQGKIIMSWELENPVQAPPVIIPEEKKEPDSVVDDDGVSEWDPENEEELRIDPNDGQPYSEKDFFKFYQAHANWQQAQPYVEYRLDPNTYEPFTKKGFFEFYHGLAEWNAARPAPQQPVAHNQPPMHQGRGGQQYHQPMQVGHQQFHPGDPRAQYQEPQMPAVAPLENFVIEEEHSDDEEFDDIPDEYLCPISQERLRDPVKDSCGQIYNRDSIEMWWASHGSDPLTNVEVSDKTLTPVPELKEEIEAWVAKAKALREHGPDALAPEPGALSRAASRDHLDY